MNPFHPKNTKRNGPEAKIQAAIVAKLKLADFFVKETHGNMFQNGLPDIFCSHPLYGQKWIEVKNPLSYSFTAAQIRDFPLMHASGVSIWILFSAEHEEMQKLFKPVNWQPILYAKAFSFKG